TRVLQKREFREPSSPDRVRLEPAERLVDIVESRRRIVLIGPSGAGKSWLLVHLAKEWIHRHGGGVSVDRIPIRVRLVDFNQTKNIEKTIVNSICRYVEAEFSAKVTQWINSPEGRSENILLLFDGYNEILSDNRWLFDNQFDSFLLHRQNRVIVSSRAYD